MDRAEPLGIASTILLAAALAAGCGGGASVTPAPATPGPTPIVTAAATPAPTPAPTATAVASRVDVTSDVRFATAPPTDVPWMEPRFDVYAPAGASGAPLVVLLPPHALAKEDAPAFAQLARAVAERGAVAVVPSWSELEDPPDLFTDPASAERIAALQRSVVGCAVAAAVSRAADYGADPSRVVLVGELYGANAAANTALDAPDPLPGCASAAPWTATGLVGWDGDWVAMMPDWDGLGEGLGRAVAALTPWSRLDKAPKIPVALVVSDAMVDLTSICGGNDAARLAPRDPTGTIRARLEEANALRDGCLDSGEAARALAAEMAASGLEATVVPLPNADGGTRMDAGAHAEELGPADLAVLADTVLEVAGPPR